MTLKANSPKHDHSGLCAEINDVIYYTGNEDYLAAQGILVEEYKYHSLVKKQKESPDAPDVTYLARAEKGRKPEILGHLLLSDPIRPDAAQVIQKLKKRGIEVEIWSGSNDARLASFARDLDVKYETNCKGSDDSDSTDSKLKNKKDLMIARRDEKPETLILMVGDSANDAFAMLESDFSIVIKSKHAHEKALAVADAELNPDDPRLKPGKPLHAILDAIDNAKQTEKSIKTNLHLNLGFNIGFSWLFTILSIGLGIMISPALGAGLMVLQSAFIFYNLKRMILKPSASNDEVMPPSETSIYDLIPKIAPIEIDALDFGCEYGAKGSHLKPSLFLSSDIIKSLTIDRKPEPSHVPLVTLDKCS